MKHIETKTSLRAAIKTKMFLSQHIIWLHSIREEGIGRGVSTVGLLFFFFI